MPPPTSTAHLLLSPAELSYLHTSLTLTPPIRPDGRMPTQFRPLIAETGILPSTNGSARVCFADGTEAIVGVKAEVERSGGFWRGGDEVTVGGGEGLSTGGGGGGDVDMEREEEEDAGGEGGRRGEDSWVEMSIEIPGFRDDDSLPIFLAAMLTEAVLADGKLTGRLWINSRFHWKLYIDVLLLSPPLSYPLPLLSLTTHLALLAARLPRLKSQGEEDPFFDDDWEAATYLYPSDKTGKRVSRPPVTLLVMSVGSNFIFDPAKEELAVAEAVLAISVAEGSVTEGDKSGLRVVCIRTIDPPSRLTSPGVPDSMNSATGGTAPTHNQDVIAQREANSSAGVWTPPRGGVKRGLLAGMIKAVIAKGGVAEEVMAGLDGVET